MKKIAMLFFIAAAASCSSNSSALKEINTDSTGGQAKSSTSMPAYPYTIKNPDNWETGSSANSMAVLTSLKKWEEGNMDESIKYFADSVRLQLDGLDKTLSRDSVKTMLAGLWNSYKTVNIKMGDWESVVSKDKKEEWVTLWYTEYMETKNGVKDSVAVINDMQLKDGKIIRLDEYNRKLH